MNGDKRGARIGLIAFQLESNAFAPDTTLDDFRDGIFAEGAEAGPLFAEHPFSRRMSELRDWTPVPVLAAVAESGGALLDTDFARVEEGIRRRLQAALPLDAVYIDGHGAGLTTADGDLDGALIAAVRAVIGSDVPIVVELDLHGNLSDRMLELADILVGYRTNPHMDHAERAAECAELLDRVLAGGCRPAVAWERVPLVTAQVMQLTAPGQPYRDILDHAQSLAGPEVLNISVFSGFAFGDSPDAGFGIVVTTNNAPEVSADLCRRIAAYTWQQRERFIPSLLSVEDAVAAMKEEPRRDSGPVVLADIADNPGGGGRGNVVHLLRQLHEAGVRRILAGVYFDPALVRQAEAAGEDGRMQADFNTEESSPLSGHWSVPVRVTRLTDGQIRNTSGIATGHTSRIGRAAALEIDGNIVLVSSIRHQVLSTDFFDHFGFDVNDYDVIIVKSRGHFRAGFEHTVPPERILEVDGPGLTTADLAAMPWQSLRRPVYPMDGDLNYEPQVCLKL